MNRMKSKKLHCQLSKEQEDAQRKQMEDVIAVGGHGRKATFRRRCSVRVLETRDLQMLESSLEEQVNDHSSERKKSANADATEEDKEAAIYHQKVRQTIAAGVEDLVRIGVDKCYFYFEDELTKQSIVFPDHSLSLEKDFWDRMIHHHHDKPTVLSISGQKYILPANCSFLMSNANDIAPLVDYAQLNGLYNLIVLDPPWYNKSAKRGSKYSFMSLWKIKSLPVPQLLAPGALVGVWVTNKQKYHKFTKSELFPHWSLELVAEWYWVKVTRRGELVTDLDSPHKKPYETLLIGQFRPQMNGCKTATSNVVKDHESNKDIIDSASKQRRADNIHVSCPQIKRKKFDNFSNTKNCCNYYTDKNVDSITTNWTMPASKSGTRLVRSKNELPNELLKVAAAESIDEHCVKCSKCLSTYEKDVSCNMTNQSDAEEQIEKGKTLQMKDEILSKWVSEMTTEVNFENVGRDDKLVKGQTGTGLESSGETCDVLPYHQVICSVPCKIHSRKPPLNEIFSQYMPHQSLCLEMFARNLTPHWTSWGNEVLKFQSVEYFDQLTPEEEKQKLNLD